MLFEILQFPTIKKKLTGYASAREKKNIVNII